MGPWNTLVSQKLLRFSYLSGLDDIQKRLTRSPCDHHWELQAASFWQEHALVSATLQGVVWLILVVLSEASSLRQCKVAEQIVHEQLSLPGGNASQPRLDQHIVMVDVGEVAVKQDALA